MNLQGKKIILGICGSIAAYKSAELCRLFVKSGAEVKVIMTTSAGDFISPLTLSTLSGYEVVTSVHDGSNWSGHVELGLWADVLVIAPITANTIAHFANGLCDTMLDAVYLSAKCTVLFAPAMDLDMWIHPSTKSNVEKLISFGNVLVPVEHGELASGLVGFGRMAEPAHILDFVIAHFNKHLDLSGKNILITAGPTHEKLDPVRFIGNSSTGKMGLALVRECLERGACVELVLGPVTEKIFTHPNLSVTNIISADDMMKACAVHFQNADIAIMAAAVADYRPITEESQKIKKSDDEISLKLVKTTDIAASLGAIKQPGQVLVGFALETENELEYAEKKRIKKNFDLIILNSMNDKGAGIGTSTNKVTIIGSEGIILATQLLPKSKIAKIIIDETIKHI
ncbi:MAG: bifunctional phosphopantothenoylcysteine decarboxylase/phosphopantothenate--cysteine ligase CoaBC [Saprospiraceae bacterium]|jgi:phosphopantothenoylcysteine decarboxylase/phosphopantothenate--cysteine ligase|nr:bifunctional phosphopantothenoylcysteine decarboxylase/phosphopantothenate--cysteine ligase CoaBC [Saprospiraceae bacterium]MBP8893605.1 bifunctional phosphopantothenoylcysteine decarboxylase/phosphopantothenate--cysteine ligase CoaBC [Saprospiraceae bacterium]MBP9125776.1 bifunctional phosphopantothenoylcysteine decarboxylase/phosphopantothenate--cysteine ligase CoaBC [Saprospiraceae bacterium]MBP9847765.1 bifunctional phosphopantothenoylcysteine decarboxylase/phosphopantothenate--cysteine l